MISCIGSLISPPLCSTLNSTVILALPPWVINGDHKHLDQGFPVSGYFMLSVLVVGICVLKVPLIINLGTALSFLAVILLMVLSYAGIGIMAAGLILVHKKGDPLTFLFDSVTESLGGVLFPLKYLEVFPGLYAAAMLTPYT